MLVLQDGENQAHSNIILFSVYTSEIIGRSNKSGVANPSALHHPLHVKEGIFPSFSIYSG